MFNSPIAKPSQAPPAQTGGTGDLHAQIAQMIAAAQGAPMPSQGPSQAPPMAPPQGPAPMAAAPQTAAPAQPGGSPQNVQRAMLAQAIRG